MKTQLPGKRLDARIALVAVSLGASPALAEDVAALKEQELSPVKLTGAAWKRHSQATVDPWTASSAAALFSRPTLGEAFKVSTEASKDDTTVGFGFSPGALWAPRSTALMNLQVLGNYATQASVVNLGLKWSTALGDVRAFNADEDAEVAQAGQQEYETCIQAQPVTEETMKACAGPQVEQQRSKIAEIAAGKPRLSFGASMGYGLDSRRLDRIAANIAFDKRLWILSLVANADLDSDMQASSEGGEAKPTRAWQVGGGVGLAWRPGFLTQLEVSAGAKVLSCLGGCDSSTPAVSLKFGPQVSYAVSEDTVFGGSLLWSGQGGTLGDALLAVGLSHSFGLQK